ncbi:nitroreductase/quinone reductase family protein [[Eubacterium] cellulosolvens]
MVPNPELPRKGSFVYDVIDDSKKKKALDKFKTINNYLVTPLYRIGILPLLGFSRIFLLLITVGRKTGKKHIFPLEYHRINNAIHIFSARGKDADWFKNLQKNPEKVEVKLGFHSFKPKIEIIHSKKEKLEVIKWYVNNHPNAAKYIFGWNSKIDDSDSGILNPLIDLIQIIKLHKES